MYCAYHQHGTYSKVACNEKHTFQWFSMNAFCNGQCSHLPTHHLGNWLNILVDERSYNGFYTSSHWQTHLPKCCNDELWSWFGGIFQCCIVRFWIGLICWIDLLMIGFIWFEFRKSTWPRICLCCCVKKHVKATIGSIGTLLTDLAIESALNMTTLCAQNPDWAV